MDKTNANETLGRIKSLMNYGLQTEGKKAAYSSVEYQKEGADGKVYAIIREGSKFYIKSAPKKANLIKEDFNYIGGFRNRKDYEYTSYAGAQKNFDLKMMSIKEAYNNRDYNVESWDIDKKENVVIEASDKMRNEILREHQIMKNAKSIMEKKAVCCDEVECPKDNIKGEKPETGDAKTADGTFSECGEKELPKEMKESAEVLGWNRSNPEYMDKSHGTEIGDSAPFDGPEARNIDDDKEPVTDTGEMKNGVVENHGVDMHNTQDQNKPAPGNGEGPSDDNNKPFDDEKGKQIDEAIDDEFGDDVEAVDADAEGEDFADDDLEGEDDFEGEEGFEDGEDFGDDSLDAEEPIDEPAGEEEAEEADEVFEDDLESRVSAMEELLGAIAEKLGVNEPAVDEENYEDDDIFGDEESEDEEPVGEEDFGAEEEEMPMESRKRNGVQIYETKNFRKAMRRQKVNEGGMTPFKDAGRVPQGNMNKLDDFGKHPAYQKKVMELPPKDFKEFPEYYDMNDDSVKNDSPYGEKIGDGAPFEIDPKSIDNAIAEAFNHLFNKKKA